MKYQSSVCTLASFLPACTSASFLATFLGMPVSRGDWLSACDLLDIAAIRTHELYPSFLSLPRPPNAGVPSIHGKNRVAFGRRHCRRRRSQSAAAPGVGHSVFDRGARDRRRSFYPVVSAARMVSRHPSRYGPQRACGEPCLPRPLLRHELAVHRRHVVPRRHELLQPAHAAGQPLPPLLVVPHRFQTTRRLPGPDRLAWFRRYRLSRHLNGRRIASADKMAGAWRLFEFDVTAAAKPGETNSLAIEVFPSLPHDLAITFVDWNPQPPDKNMGLWRDVYVTATGPVAVRFPTVTTRLNSPANDLAQLTVKAELKNASGQAADGVLKGKIEGIEFSQPVRLGPGETRVVRFTQELSHPRLWWPAQAGPQNLYPLDVQFEVNGSVSDSSHIDFGVREVTSEIDGQGHRLFHINGKNILIRGAGYTFDMLLRETPERQESELRYVRDTNLNAVRFEGKLEDDHFLELCDRYGILVMAGWCCCDHWEQWPQWDQEDETIAAASLRDQLRRLARHPAVFDWLYGSDNPPPPA